MRLLTRAIAVATLLALFIALDPSSAAAQAPAPEPDPIQNVGASDAAQTDPAQPRRPSEAELAADTELGQMIAVELGKVIGVALSPAVGLAVAGLVHAQDPAVLAAADRLFAVPQAPYAGFYF